jgi:hypothetical protein
MTLLGQFDIRGESIVDDETGTKVFEGDPHRGLVRYRPGAPELFVHARINLALWRVAVALPIVLLKPIPGDGEKMDPHGLLGSNESMRNFRFRARLIEVLAAREVPACYLADQHGDCRRDFYFVTEDWAGFEAAAREAAAAFDMPIALEPYTFTQVAPTILPADAIGELGLVIPAHLRVRPIRFEFWGAEETLARLRRELEGHGYRFFSFETYLRELRMIKDVPIDSGFEAVLMEVVRLSRSLGCSYLGTETVDGFDQFALTRPLPARYAKPAPAGGGLVNRIFGRKGA